MGSKYKVTGINDYALTNKCEIRSLRKLDVHNTLYTDSFVSVGV